MTVGDCILIDTTLREGEQHEHANFTFSDKIEIAVGLAGLGVDFLELTSPMASPGSAEICRRLAAMDLGRTRVMAHIRCHQEDAAVTADTGVHGINLVIGLSPRLRAASHGLSLEQMIDRAREVLADLRRRRPDALLRFSTEDTFRSPLDDILALYDAVAAEGLADRFAVADTTGGADPFQVHDLVRDMRARLGTDIEFHGHDDTGCAVANAYAAWRAGASYINVSLLGLGERNGITPTESFLARLYVDDPEAIRARYDLTRLPGLARMISAKSGLAIPFNQCVVGEYAFTHKAGMHTKAVLRDPGSYEILAPEDFGRERTLSISHRLTGWNAVRVRAESLGLELTDDALRAVTRDLKAHADEKGIGLAELDALLTAADRGKAG